MFFAVVGPSTCNSLSDSLSDPALSLSLFRCRLKTHFLRNNDKTYCGLDFFYENVLHKFILRLLIYFTLLNLMPVSCKGWQIKCYVD